MKKELLAFAAIIATAASSQAMTSIYTNDFEGQADGYAITNDAAWTKDDNAVAIVTNIAPYLNTSQMNTPYMGAPFAGAPGVLSFADGLLTNNCSSGSPKVSIDAMIQPSISQELTYDTAVSNSHFSIAFLTNGVAVWHGIVTNPATQYGTDFHTWEILNASSTPVASSKWCRLTITLNYQALPTDGFGSYNAMFQVKIDGQPLVSPYGHVDADMASATNGSWLAMAPALPPTQIQHMALNGVGMLDDLNIIPADPAEMITTAHGIPYNWLTYMGVTNDVSSNAMAAAEIEDADGDGMVTWQEYLAGTYPTNKNSRLVILSTTLSNGIPVIKWLGSSQALANYTIAGSTNLMDPNAWANLATATPKDSTNEASLTSAPASSIGFFRVKVVK